EALTNARRRLRIHGIAVEIVLEDVGGGREPGRKIARLEEMIRVREAAHAHVAEAVEDVLVVENPVRHDKIVDQPGVPGWGGLRGLPRRDGGERHAGTTYDHHTPDVRDSHIDLYLRRSFTFAIPAFAHASSCSSVEPALPTAPMVSLPI